MDNQIGNIDKEILTKHFVDTPQQSFSPEKPPYTPTPYLTRYETDFTKAGRDFWYRTTPDMFKGYNKGTILGTVAGEKSDIREFLTKMVKTLEEACGEELRKNGITMEQYKDIFSILYSTINVLYNRLLTQNVNKDMIVAIIHGFINMYTESTISKRK